MKVIRVLKVSATQFFDLLNKSLIADVKKCSEKEIEVADIVVGLKYDKEIKAAMGNSNRVTVELMEYLPNSKYVSKITSAKGEWIVSYEVEEVEGGLAVTYGEESVFVKRLDRWNFNLVSVLYKKRTERNMLSNLVAVESVILEENKEN